MPRGIIRFIIIFLSAAIVLHSQSLKNYGLKIGAAISDPVWQIDSQNYNGADIRIGIDAGLFLEWGLSQRFSLLTEAHYIQKGLKYSMPVVEPQAGGTSFYVEKTNPFVDYLSFPVLTKFKLFNAEDGIYIIGGLRIDFVLSKNNVNDTRWLYSNVKDVDYGGTIGFGVQTRSPLGIGAGFEVKYSPSFNKVSSSSFAEITNRTVDVNFVLFY